MRSAVQTRLSRAQPQPANADLNLAADDRCTERRGAGTGGAEGAAAPPVFFCGQL